MKRIVTDVLRSSALRGWSVQTSLLLEWGQSVGLVLWGSLETHKSAMVSIFYNGRAFFSLPGC